MTAASSPLLAEPVVWKVTWRDGNKRRTAITPAVAVENTVLSLRPVSKTDNAPSAGQSSLAGSDHPETDAGSPLVVKPKRIKKRILLGETQATGAVEKAWTEYETWCDRVIQNEDRIVQLDDRIELADIRLNEMRRMALDGELDRKTFPGIEWLDMKLEELVRRHREKSRVNINYQLPWEYNDLRADQFRLLQVHPGHAGDDLEISIVSTQLPPSERRENYDALSYVWGDSNRKYRVKCRYLGDVDHGRFGGSRGILGGRPQLVDGGYVEINENLQNALIGLRNEARYRPLWVDAVCINQGHTRERNQQVANMFNIYSSGREVIIWLGNPDADTGAAFDCIERLSKSCTLDIMLGIFVGDPGIEWKAIPPYEWVSLMKLLQRPWFGRLWTMQEAIANFNTTVRCGKYSASCRSLERACGVALSLIYGCIPSSHTQTVQNQYMPMLSGETVVHVNRFSLLNTVDEDPQPRALQTQESSWRDNIERFLVVGRCRSALAMQRHQGFLEGFKDGLWTRLQPPGHSAQALKELDLRTLLPLARQRNCADERDKVFGLLGLARLASDNGVEVDYSRTVRDVYIGATRYWLQSGDQPDISFLHHAGNTNPRHFLPSWVPDWSLPTNRPSLAAYLKPGLQFTTATPRPAEADISYTFGNAKAAVKLSVKGAVLMRVQEVNAPQILARVAQLAEAGVRYPTTPHSYAEAIEDACLLDPRSEAPCCKFWEFKATPAKEVERKCCDGRKDSGAGAGKHIPSAAAAIEGMQVLIDEVGRTLGRRLLMSRDGFIGFGPEQSRAGDLVCLLFGANTPFVLRRTESYYRLIGECYVYGVMSGEALVEIPPDKVQRLELH